MHESTAARPGSLFFVRQAQQQRWRQVPTLSSLLEMIERSAHEICVVEVTDGSVSFKGLWEQWNRMLLSVSGVGPDQPVCGPTPIPWVRSASPIGVASVLAAQ